ARGLASIGLSELAGNGADGRARAESDFAQAVALKPELASLVEPPPFEFETPPPGVDVVPVGATSGETSADGLSWGTFGKFLLTAAGTLAVFAVSRGIAANFNDAMGGPPGAIGVRCPICGQLLHRCHCPGR